MPLFEVAIIKRPTKKESEEGGSDELVMEPKAVVAKDAQGAAIAAVIGNKGLESLDLTRVDVLVRPFV